MEYCVESYSTGFIVCDYSGNRGQFGAAYTDKTGEWKSQPVGFTDLFKTKDDAEFFIEENLK